MLFEGFIYMYSKLNFGMVIYLIYFIFESSSFYIRINLFMEGSDSLLYYDEDNYLDVFNDSFE